jgi:hypothetical protein
MNDLIKIDRDILREINYRLDSANGSGVCDESFCFTQEQVDARATAEVNGLLRQALEANSFPGAELAEAKKEMLILLLPPGASFDGRNWEARYQGDLSLEVMVRGSGETPIKAVTELLGGWAPGNAKSISW